VILLDVNLPDMDGFEVATLIRQRGQSRETPIIFITAFNTNEQFMAKGYTLGAVDYLIKPIASHILLSKVSIFIELYKTTAALLQQTKALQQKTAQLEAINIELQISEERFRLLSTYSPIGVFVTDVEGHCLYANPRLYIVCGFSLQEECQDWWQAVHCEDQERAIATWSAYAQREQEYSQEFRFQWQGGEVRWAHVRSARMLSEQNKFLGHVGTIEDITERKLAETANTQIIREQAARQEAEAANRMKDEFITVLSHELRTPLNSMLGWSRLLRSRQYDETMVAQAMEIIERNAIAQTKLIEDILDVSQIVRGKLQLHYHPVDLVAVTQAAIATVQPCAEEKGITLVNNFQEFSTVLVRGDSVRLQQVIWNLLTNAVKFTSSDGFIEVHLSIIEEPCPQESSSQKLHLEELRPEELRPEELHSQTRAQLQVRDTGIGINPEFLPYVFDRFRQADSTTTRSHGGLGLGLAIVRYLVEQHQGTVQAESSGVNQGALFTIKLPCLQPDRQPAGWMPLNRFTHDSRPQSLNGIAVIIVDDDQDTREFLTFLLQDVGSTVITATSGTEALQLLQSVQPAILLCDISMPDMDGYTLIQKIRTQLPHPQAQIPAIAITANARILDQEQALAAGFQKHLPKPIEPETLVEEILQSLNQLHSP